MFDRLAWCAVSLLQLDYFLVEVQAHQRRLTPLPGKASHWESQLHVVFDESFENFIAHPLTALADLCGPVLVEAIPAIDVAVGSRRFDQKCEWLHQNSGQSH